MFIGIRRVVFTSIVAAAIAVGSAHDSGQTTQQYVEYNSPEGVEYRSPGEGNHVRPPDAGFSLDRAWKDCQTVT